MPSRIAYGSSVLILPSHLRLGLSWDHFHLRFPTTIHYPFLFYMCHMPCPCYLCLSDHLLFRQFAQSFSTNTCAEALGLLPLLFKLLQQELKFTSVIADDGVSTFIKLSRVSCLIVIVVYSHHHTHIESQD